MPAAHSAAHSSARPEIKGPPVSLLLQGDAGRKVIAVIHAGHGVQAAEDVCTLHADLEEEVPLGCL